MPYEISKDRVDLLDVGLFEIDTGDEYALVRLDDISVFSVVNIGKKVSILFILRDGGHIDLKLSGDLIVVDQIILDLKIAFTERNKKAPKKE